MKILLSDGSGQTSRQLATILGRAGHRVEVLTSTSLCLCRFTRRVQALHQIPNYGADPLRWLDRAIQVCRRGGFDLLLPTQEQAAVLSAGQGRLAAEGLRCPLPPFPALAQVQDKVSAFHTLDRLAIPQPDATVISTGSALSAWSRFPVFVKLGIGTASGGVRMVHTGNDLDRLRTDWLLPRTGELAQPLLMQQPVDGELIMTQAVFDHGRLIACHAAARLGAAAQGGAAHKRSRRNQPLVDHLARLGSDLGWHGALSADVIDTGADVPFIDLNPRLVEPMSAILAGVDLVGPMLELATGKQPVSQPIGPAGVASHQLLLRLLGIAGETGRRRPVLQELITAIGHRGLYHGSTEELTPPDRDPVNLAFRAGVPAALLINPGLARRLTGGSVDAYALTGAGWETIKEFARHSG